VIVCQGCLALRRYPSDARKYPSEMIDCCLVSHALSGRYGKADGLPFEQAERPPQPNS
jgi:hypothetical protein